MDGGIDRVLKLPGEKVVGDGGGQFLYLCQGAFHPLGPLGEHQLRPVGLHQLAALHTHGLRHNKNETVSSGRRQGRQGNPRVAGGGLYDHGAGGQQPLCLPVVQHGLGHPVLHGAGGLEGLHLGKYTGGQPVLLLQAGQLQQGCFADQLVGGCEWGSHIECLLTWVKSSLLGMLQGRLGFHGREGLLQIG